MFKTPCKTQNGSTYEFHPYLYIHIVVEMANTYNTYQQALSIANKQESLLCTMI